MDVGNWIALFGAAVALLVGISSIIFTAIERKARITELELLRRQVEGRRANAQADGALMSLLPRAASQAAHRMTSTSSSS